MQLVLVMHPMRYNIRLRLRVRVFFWVVEWERVHFFGQGGSINVVLILIWRCTLYVEARLTACESADNIANM